MRRIALVAFLLLPAFAHGQTVLPRNEAAIPPDRAALERLNLRSEWTAYIPIEGRQDGLARVQTADDSQVFVQTRAGFLVSLDAFTGRTLWSFKLPTGYSSHFPVGWNARYVFVLNVAKLFVLDRYKGSLELEFDLPKAPATGPVADSDNFYVGLTGATVQGFRMPRELLRYPLPPEKPGEGGLVAAIPNAEKPKSPADAVAERFNQRLYPVTATREHDRFTYPETYMTGGGNLGSNQRTPSLAMLQTVVPPYSVGNLRKVESLQALPSVHKPYSLHPEHLKYNQQTPSLAMLSTVHNLSEQSSLRPPSLRPQPIWTYGAKDRVLGEPVLVTGGTDVAKAVWVIQAGPSFAALAAVGQAQAEGRFDVAPVSSLGGPYAYGKDLTLGFLSLNDGRVLALDMMNTRGISAHTEWQAKVGGYLNHRPLAATDGVYVSGDRSGITRIDVKTGEVSWRTGEDADTLLAMNDDHIYALDRRGQLLVFEKARATDTLRQTAKPVTAMPMGGFNFPVTNDTTDRLYLAADSGLIVCLRDSGAKYAKPKRFGPPAYMPPAPPPVPEKKPDENPAPAAN